MSVPETDRSEFARDLLQLAAESYEQAQRNRVNFAKAARRHGITFRDIADAYGVTEGAIRKMLRRAEDNS